MQIKFIGTSSGKTSLERFHSSFLILYENFNLLVDTGDGISKALLKQGIDYNSIDGIIISHFHPDHFSGLASLIVQFKLINRTKELKIFIHRKLSEILKTFLANSYLFEERMDFKINYELFEHDSLMVAADEIKFVSKQNSHLDDYIKNDKDQELNFICSSFLFSLKNKNIFYTGDIGTETDLYLFRDCTVNLIISETTHITTAGLLEMIHALNPDEIYLTHFDDEIYPELLSWKSTLSDQISNKIIIASDGMTISI